MKPDIDPGRASELGVLFLLLLTALAGASLSDFLLAPHWTTLAEAWEPVDDGDRQAVLVDPWIPQLPDAPASVEAVDPAVGSHVISTL